MLTTNMPISRRKDNMKYTIDKPLLTLNEYIKIERGNKYAAANIKKSETTYCMIRAKKSLKPVYSYPVDILIEWHVTGRKDPDNVAFGIKFILDGLVKSGIIENDGSKQIRNIHHTYVRDKEQHCIVELKQVN